MIFSEIADINPKVKLSRGEAYPFVEMSDITPGKRYVKAENNKIFKGGGSKFEPNDVLFARITPCLENGKIAQFKGSNKIAGFGSTEFFVFRAKRGISDGGFLYYLASSDVLRKPAEGSMFGASGRQRAVLEVVRSVEIPKISLTNQRKISVALSAYDDLIENNIRRIRILEEMCQRIYREWFVDFRFPGHGKVKFAKSELGMIPVKWEINKLGDICNITMGQSPKSEFYNENGDGLPFHQGVTDFNRIFPKTRMFCTVQNRIANEGDILFSVRAPVGRINIANIKIIIGRGLCAIRSKTNHQCLVYLLLKEKFKEEDTMGGGTIFKSVTKDDVHTIQVLYPPEELIRSFEDIVEPALRSLKNLTIKNENLRLSRDILLPKLISGEIDVSEIDIAIQEQENGA